MRYYIQNQHKRYAQMDTSIYDNFIDKKYFIYPKLSINI